MCEYHIDAIPDYDNMKEINGINILTTFNRCWLRCHKMHPIGSKQLATNYYWSRQMCFFTVFTQIKNVDRLRKGRTPPNKVQWRWKNDFWDAILGFWFWFADGHGSAGTSQHYMWQQAIC